MTLRALDRRRFLHAAARALGSAIGTTALSRANVWGPNIRAGIALSANENLRLALIDAASGHVAGSPFAMGVTLGIAEAGRAATLLGGRVSLIAHARSTRDATALLERGAIDVLVCGVSAEDTATLGAAATKRGVVLINALAPADALRNEGCARFTFHVAASHAMRADAQRLSSAQIAATSAADDREIVLWDSHLERFGAAQLNARFAARFRRPMDSDAWAGWFAVKVVWEASRRARSTDANAIAEYLAREDVQFDGQKGVPLSFRSWDHQLRQPLYVRSRALASSSAEPAQVPATGATTSAKSALDTLGTSAEASSCRLT
ncbi:MAG TPA: hypothetical protein VM076_03355 [Gemmatimonadaceae bacterium]|nr:hypothetical protein [Gemmatimonadaceae bacterium]